jgi:hypothetical protein
MLIKGEFVRKAKYALLIFKRSGDEKVPKIAIILPQMVWGDGRQQPIIS